MGSLQNTKLGMSLPDAIILGQNPDRIKKRYQVLEEPTSPFQPR